MSIAKCINDSITLSIINIEKLTASKKNIICFAKDLPCFSFLLKNRLSLFEHQLSFIMINEYNISTLLEEHWTQQVLSSMQFME